VSSDRWKIRKGTKTILISKRLIAKKAGAPQALGVFSLWVGWMDLVAIAQDLQLDLAYFIDFRDGKMFVI